MQQGHGSGSGTLLAAALLLAACATPVAAPATPVDTGSLCVTALHEEATEAGPLPRRLTSLLSPAGQRLLAHCDACANYPAIAASFTTQVTQAFCGVASSVTVLNASAAQKPLTDPYKPYPYFTQCNIFNAKARQRLDLATVSNEGLTLAQATWLLNAQARHPRQLLPCRPGRRCRRRRPGRAGLCGRRFRRRFRKLARRTLAQPQHYVLVNFSRATLSDDNRAAATSRRSPPTTARPTICC